MRLRRRRDDFSESSKDLRDGTVTVADHKLGEIRFPASDRTIAPSIRAAGGWEALEGRWLDDHVRPGMSVWNIGANVGYFALWVRQLVGETGLVLAVEPSSENFACLRHNIATRGFTNVSLMQAAASDESGETTLYMSEENCGDHRLFASADSSALTTVRQIMLDEIERDRPIDVILTDTQGWDHRVLRGARTTIAEDHPLILTEFVPSWLRDLGEDPIEVLAEYRSWGYRISVLEAGTAPGDWTDDQILDWIESAGRVFVNLELWPSARALDATVRLSADFWSPEPRLGQGRWLVRPQGTITATGPPKGKGHLHLRLRPPPQATASVSFGISGQAAVEDVEINCAQDFDLPIALDDDGVARLVIEEKNGPVHVDHDARPLHLRVVEAKFEIVE